MAYPSLRPSPTALLNPRCDPIFKTLFTQNTPESNDALRDLISALLGEEVRTIRLLPAEPSDRDPAEKRVSFDVHAVLGSGEPVEIEMQGRDREHSFAGRSEAHVARLLSNAVTRGMDWRDIPKVYQISILNFTHDADDKSAFSWYTMRKKGNGRDEDSSGLRLSDRLNVIYLELTKIRKLRGTPVSRLTRLQKWGMFLAYADNAEMRDYVRQITDTEANIMKANAMLEAISVNTENWWEQYAYEDHLRDINTELAWAREDGEHKRALEDARNLARLGVSMDIIVQATGLSPEEIGIL